MSIVCANCFRKGVSWLTTSHVVVWSLLKQWTDVSLLSKSSPRMAYNWTKGSYFALEGVNPLPVVAWKCAKFDNHKAKLTTNVICFELKRKEMEKETGFVSQGNITSDLQYYLLMINYNQVTVLQHNGTMGGFFPKTIHEKLCSVYGFISTQKSSEFSSCCWIQCHIHFCMQSRKCKMPSRISAENGQSSTCYEHSWVKNRFFVRMADSYLTFFFFFLNQSIIRPAPIQ